MRSLVFHTLRVLLADDDQVALDLGQRVVPDAVYAVARADKLLSNSEPID